MEFYNYERIEELEDLIYEAQREEIIFMERPYQGSAYILLDNLSEKDKHRILLINTCETYKADNKNYEHLIKITKSRDTIEACKKIIGWQEELIRLYEDELQRVGLGAYEYEYKNQN